MTAVLLLDPLPGHLLSPCLAAGLRFVAGPPAAVALAIDHCGGVVPPTLQLVSGGPAAVVAALRQGAADAEMLDAAPSVIVARLATLAERFGAAAPLVYGPLTLDRLARKARRDDRPLDLLPREYALLHHLAEHAGEPVPRAELLRRVWGLAFDPGTNLVAVHVSRLRARLDRGFAWAMLRTEPGCGYRLVAQPG